jgi:wyosine [tRNA(Phe)-imidazoG37] synthetase (radical SAM superfamily)
MNYKIIALNEKSVGSVQLVMGNPVSRNFACMNKCKFCCVETHMIDAPLDSKKFSPEKYWDTYWLAVKDISRYTPKSVVLTSNGEPLLYMDFLLKSLDIVRNTFNHEHRVELQTSGLTLDSEKIQTLIQSGVKTFNVSISSIWSSDSNAEYNQTPVKHKVQFEKLVDQINAFKKDYPEVRVRLTLILTDAYTDQTDPSEIFKKAKEMGVDEITFKKLIVVDQEFNSPKAIEVQNWIQNHRASNKFETKLIDYLEQKGKSLGELSFGKIWDIQGISVVFDENCMETERKETETRYLVLFPNLKVANGWDPAINTLKDYGHAYNEIPFNPLRLNGFFNKELK